MTTMESKDYMILGFAFTIFLVLAIYLIPELIDKYKKCGKCGSRFNKQHICGQYGSGWYECRCEWENNQEPTNSNP